jgi:hypothetical protein
MIFTLGLAGGVCDHAAAATMPTATMTAGTISLFMRISLRLRLVSCFD